MKANKLLVAAALAMAIGAPVAGFLGDTNLAQPITSAPIRVPFLHGLSTDQPEGQSELASLEAAHQWINSPPLTASALRGKVVLIDFWTYTCINWMRTLPYVQAWDEKYRKHGLVVIGIHAPEFAFEKDLSNVHRAVKDLGIDYPIAVDNDHLIWRAFSNQYWPALYFIDSRGRVRYHHLGEGSYQQTEMVIQELLAEAGASGFDQEPVSVDARGVEAAADWENLKSPENYLGYECTQNFASGDGLILDKPRTYDLPARLRLNEWGLSGDWTVRKENAVLKKSDGRIAYRFHARDLHLVMRPAAPRTAARFRVLIEVTEQRLYQLIRQPNPIVDRQFEIEFLNSGVEIFAFTFG